MRSWEDYKRHVRSIDSDSKRDMEEIEALAEIVSSVIKKRMEMGISQRELAAECNIQQSSVARIESFKTTPKLDTLMKLMRPLGLKLQVAPIA